MGDLRTTGEDRTDNGYVDLNNTYMLLRETNKFEDRSGLAEKLLQFAQGKLNQVISGSSYASSCLALWRGGLQLRRDSVKLVLAGFQYREFTIASTLLDSTLAKFFEVNEGDPFYIFTTNGQNMLDRRYYDFSKGGHKKLSRYIEHDPELKLGNWIQFSSADGGKSIRLAFSVQDAENAAVALLPGDCLAQGPPPPPAPPESVITSTSHQ